MNALRVSTPWSAPAATPVDGTEGSVGRDPDPAQAGAASAAGAALHPGPRDCAGASAAVAPVSVRPADGRRRPPGADAGPGDGRRAPRVQRRIVSHASESDGDPTDGAGGPTGGAGVLSVADSTSRTGGIDG